MEARQLIVEGSSWQVGNGLSINVWEDRWLREEGGRKVNSRKPEGCSVEKVSDLLNQQEVGWNAQLLNQLFCAQEASAIRKVPVSSLGLTDKLVWHATKSGQYSVQSGYKLVKSMQKQREGDEGSSERRELEDKKLWQTI